MVLRTVAQTTTRGQNHSTLRRRAGTRVWLCGRHFPMSTASLMLACLGQNDQIVFYWKKHQKG